MLTSVGTSATLEFSLCTAVSNIDVVICVHQMQPKPQNKTTCWPKSYHLYFVFISICKDKGCDPVQTPVSSAPGEITWRFFSPPRALLTNCRHAFLPHCSSCGYIQTVTSAVRSSNMCTRPVKPNHCVLEGFTMKRAFYNSPFADRNVHSPLVKRAGRIQMNVISVTAGFFYLFFLLVVFFVVLLWLCVGGAISCMPLWVYGRLSEPPHVSVRCRQVWTCTPSKEVSLTKPFGGGKCSRTHQSLLIHPFERSNLVWLVRFGSKWCQ